LLIRGKLRLLHGLTPGGLVSMSFTENFGRQPRALIVAETAAALLVIAAFDFVTDHKIPLASLCSVPIFVLAWFCGKKWGIAAASSASLLWWYVKWSTGDPILDGSSGAWATSWRFGFFLIVALVGSALRTKSDIAADRIARLERGSRRLEREIVNISEAEQRRIGQDLHDGLCQYLAGLTCGASSLRDDLKKLHVRSEADTAGELVNLLQDAVVQARDLAHELVPAQVSRLGLVVALESLAQSVARMYCLTCRFQFHGGPPNWDEQTAMHLYRIAQEAINNATRHGKARNILVFLDATDHSISLRVLDDGVGISDSYLDGMGLTVMRYRARSIGGEVTVERRNGTGTTVLCTVRTDSQANEIAAA
jgi:signal transduction histidine kinase